MRSIWKGHIRFSLVTIPIRIYNAVDTAQTIRFNQLHKACNGQVGYDKKCKKCSKKVGNQDIVKGYQYEPEQYVIIEQEDLEKIKLKSTKVIEIEGFVDATEIHPTLYDAPYFAGPDGEVAAKVYTLFCETLKASGKMGVGRVVLRDREDVVMIGPERGGLILYKLRTPSEVRKMEDVPQLDGGTANPEELKLAQSLVDSLTTTLNKIDLKDRYQDALREMVQAKIEGKEVITVAEEPQPVVDIMTALKDSIDQAKKQREPMMRAKGVVKKAKTAKKTVRGKKKVA